MSETLNSRISELENSLLQYDQTLQSRIEQTVKNYNPLIRNQIRVETALRLSQGEKLEKISADQDSQISLFSHNHLSRNESQGKTAVPIKIINGLSKPIQIVIESMDSDYWKVFLLTLINKPLLHSTCLGLGFVEENHCSIEMFRHWFSVEVEPLIDLSAIQHSQKVLQDIVCILDANRLIQKIKDIDLNPDIESELLGAYFYRPASTHGQGSWIELYWMSIGVIALELNVSPEALTIVTLTHELVHAYTHLGQDTDHEVWDTQDFHRSDLAIVEGLAQFYTEIICLKLSARQPDIYIAFQRLKDNQADVYNAYSDWIDKSALKSSKKGSEMIRSVMIECRKKGIVCYDQFMSIIRRESSRIL